MHLSPYRKDTFCLKMADLGNLHHVTIRHDNRGTSHSWYLVHVEVQDERGVVYHFPCNQWLSRDEGDSCIERTLTLGGGAEQVESAGRSGDQSMGKGIWPNKGYYITEGREGGGWRKGRMGGEGRMGGGRGGWVERG